MLLTLMLSALTQEFVIAHLVYVIVMPDTVERDARELFAQTVALVMEHATLLTKSQLKVVSVVL